MHRILRSVMLFQEIQLDVGNHPYITHLKRSLPYIFPLIRISLRIAHSNNAVKTLVNHPQNHRYNQWYKHVMDGL